MPVPRSKAKKSAQKRPIAQKTQAKKAARKTSRQKAAGAKSQAAEMLGDLRSSAEELSRKVSRLLTRLS